MKNRIYLLLISIALLSACKQAPSENTPVIKKGMIKVSIFYPNGEGKTFDMDYYTTKHMPLVAKELGDSLKTLTIDKGLSGRAPTDTATFLAIGHLYFESVSAYRNAMKQHGDKIRADIPNYTNIQPVVQVSEIMQ